MSNRRYLQHWGLSALLALSALGCGPEFDPPSKLQSLRVLAVKKDDPYLRPAAKLGTADGYRPDNIAHMTLAMQDARLEEDKQGVDGNPPSLQKLWFAGCNNPPRDNYFSCLLSVWLSFKVLVELGPGPAGLADGQYWSVGEHISDIGPLRIAEFLQQTFPKQWEQSQNPDDPTAQDPSTPAISQEELLNLAMALRVGAGDTFDYEVPSWVIDQHPPSQDRDIPRYGLSQVFLAVCDGEIGYSPGWEKDVDPLATLTDATRGFPLTCYERGTKKQRGPDNFMVSYSNLYVYDDLSNKNPVIEGFRFDGKDVADSALCIGEDCLAKPAPASCESAPEVQRVKLCDPKSSSGCKEYDIRPTLAESKNSELDDIASMVGGGNEQLREQMWIRYYADRGAIARDTKRLQDANEGWFTEYATKWTVPSEGEGITSIWSVVYDNRGGVDWVRISICLEK